MQSTVPSRRFRWLRPLLVALAVYALVIVALMIWWDHEPDRFDVAQSAQARLQPGQSLATGYVTVATLIRSAESMLDKRGGYLSNDKLPPGVLMDNVPNWEFGVLTATRDLARALRNDFSRSQSQSAEDKDLQEADPLFSSPNDRWLLPSSEGQYRKAIKLVESYAARLADPGRGNAQFFARADNLADYLQVASGRLGSLSQRLSASVGQVRLETSLGDPGDGAGTSGGPLLVKTPWLKIDDNFYEARGYTWALREQLEAIAIDFGPVLRDKNAVASLEQVIRELEEAQHRVWSPMILNGSPYGFFANHSLVLANYVSRANAALIELRTLLRRG
ncbi:MAG: DUF2333 family protein [Dokdonella sp.]|jgi:hypothetical protein|nr:DUF2333 family protein [Dokdonella sp.]